MNVFSTLKERDDPENTCRRTLIYGDNLIGVNESKTSFVKCIGTIHLSL